MERSPSSYPPGTPSIPTAIRAKQARWPLTGRLSEKRPTRAPSTRPSEVDERHPARLARGVTLAKLEKPAEPFSVESVTTQNATANRPVRRDVGVRPADPAASGISWGNGELW
jgi:hypothetical protein